MNGVFEIALGVSIGEIPANSARDDQIRFNRHSYIEKAFSHTNLSTNPASVNRKKSNTQYGDKGSVTYAADQTVHTAGIAEELARDMAGIGLDQASIF